ncbi:ribosomal protein S18-alanine N-acetyltransferase [Kineococcus gynurae]|uniref:Ribosomal protein S18-alanine N-acetyltransferase n=1 Tax=Kineococcus gynurae TaxID=452979 RepID=A0ABV5LTC9_9ACTN
MTGDTSPGDPVLRPMRWWDVEPVARLERELFGATAWTTEMFWAELARPDRGFLVVDDGAVAGYGGVLLSGSESDLQTIAVAERLQGRGIGRRLLRALTDLAVARGARRMLLEVRADNAGAQALYASEGFAPIARRARYYQPGDVDAVIMRATLGRGADVSPAD